MIEYPKDWEEKILNDCISNVSYFNYILKPKTNGQYPVIQQGNNPIAGYAHGQPYQDFEKIILFGDHTLSLYKPVKRFFVSSDGLRILRCENINRDYLFFALKKFIPESEGYKRHYSIIKEVIIPVPREYKEQQTIASTLSDFDQHIDNLSELIEKKKAIRDGALEDLVSGRTRVDGFDGEWEEVSFSEVIIPKARIGWQGLKKNEYLKSGYSYLIGGTDFNNGTINFENISYVCKERYEMDSNIQVADCDVLVTKDGTIGKVAIVPLLDKPATLNSGVFVFRTSNKLNSSFLYRVLSSSLFRSFIDTLSAGSTIKHLYQKDLKNFKFKIPKDILEQQAIASILTAMDEEITALEDEKDKMIQIREGAMDDLLTGRIRLKV